MGRLSGKTCRLISMMALTGSFFLVELIFGYISNSLALIGDSYHMLSDLVALVVGLASVRISKWTSKKNTYGWARAEVVGALVNSVFLLALCFTIFVEAVTRLFEDEHIENPKLLIIVGSVGLAINVVGLILFGTHSHSHGGGGHGHSHSGGGHGHSHNGGKKCASEQEKDKQLQPLTQNGNIRPEDIPYAQEIVDDTGEDEDDENCTDGKDKAKIASSAQLNMRGVFLHVLGDALGSVIVIISAICIMFIEADWKHKIDPILSIVLVIIITSTTFPLLRESALILLQTVPTHIQVRTLQDRLVSAVEGVLDVHEFHIWQLAGNRIIASAHIRCQNPRDYMRVAEEVKRFFHKEGIHSTTIQPEFVEVEGKGVEGDCMLECGPDKTCHIDTCCANRKSKVFSGGDGEVSTVRLRANGHSSAGELAAAMGDGAADGGLQFVAIQASSDGDGDDVVVR